eukprot:m.29345 g.29345  ORF g.29345 m.29345 type:complete len:258 (-) comp9565_c0_seq1:954-1727(-)
MVIPTQQSAEVDPKVLEGLTDVQIAKLRCAYAAVDANIKDGLVLGIGSGSTIVFAVDRIAQRVKEENFKLKCVPTSFQAIQLIRKHGLELSDLSATPQIDVAIDGADELSPEMDCIKGGGGCLVQEKIVAFNAKKFVVIADGSKEAEHLGTKWLKGVPIEVIPMAYVPILEKLKEFGVKEAAVRMAKSKAGPCVTDNGNFIIDAHFGALEGDLAPAALEQKLRSVAGVVDCGLFVGMADEAFIARSDGSVWKYSKEQ